MIHELLFAVFVDVLKGQEHLNQVDVHVFWQFLVDTDVHQAHVFVHLDFPKFVELVGHVPVGVFDRVVGVVRVER